MNYKEWILSLDDLLKRTKLEHGLIIKRNQNEKKLIRLDIYLSNGYKFGFVNLDQSHVIIVCYKHNSRLIYREVLYEWNEQTVKKWFNRIKQTKPEIAEKPKWLVLIEIQKNSITGGN